MQIISHTRWFCLVAASQAFGTYGHQNAGHWRRLWLTLGLGPMVVSSTSKTVSCGYRRNSRLHSSSCDTSIKEGSASAPPHNCSTTWTGSLDLVNTTSTQVRHWGCQPPDGMVAAANCSLAAEDVMAMMTLDMVQSAMCDGGGERKLGLVVELLSCLRRENIFAFPLRVSTDTARQDGPAWSRSSMFCVVWQVLHWSYFCAAHGYLPMYTSGRIFKRLHLVRMVAVVRG